MLEKSYTPCINGTDSIICFSLGVGAWRLTNHIPYSLVCIPDLVNPFFGLPSSGSPLVKSIISSTSFSTLNYLLMIHYIFLSLLQLVHQNLIQSLAVCLMRHIVDFQC